MPKARRNRAAKHETAPGRMVLDAQNEDLDMEEMQEDISFDMREEQPGLEDVETSIPLTAKEDLLDASGEVPTRAAPGPHRTKKEKQKSKRDALMQRLTESAIPVSPYSKSHQRRQKRKTKQSLGLGSITAALEEAVPMDEGSLKDANTASERPRAAELVKTLEKEQKKDQAKKQPGQPGKIGSETMHKNLSSKQRQKMLTQEQKRLPAILSHKSFAASPFETIRLHAQNTVVPLERSRKAGTA